MVDDIKKELDEFIGDDTVQALKGVIKTIKENGVDNVALNELVKYEERLVKDNIDVKSLLIELVEWADKFKVDVPKEFEVTVKNQLELPEYPKEMKVSNLKDIKIPEVRIPKPVDTVGIKESKWLGNSLGTIVKTIGSVTKQVTESLFRARIVGNSSPAQAIAVRMVTKDGKKFTEGGGGTIITGNRNPGLVPFKTAARVSKEALIDDDRHLQVDVLTAPQPSSATNFEGGPVTVGTAAVEITFTGVTQSIQIESDVDNTGYIYIGKSNVTNAGANAMSKLEPGASIAMSLNDASAAVYAVSDTAGQTIYKLATI